MGLRADFQSIDSVNPFLGGRMGVFTDKCGINKTKIRGNHAILSSFLKNYGGIFPETHSFHFEKEQVFLRDTSAHFGIEKYRPVIDYAVSTCH